MQKSVLGRTWKPEYIISAKTMTQTNMITNVCTYHEPRMQPYLATQPKPREGWKHVVEQNNSRSVGSSEQHDLVVSLSWSLLRRVPPYLFLQRA